MRILTRNREQSILVLSIIVGLASGLAAVLLKNLVHYTFHFVSRGFQFGTENYLFLLLPFIGITHTWVFTKYILKHDLGHGVSRILYALSKRNGLLERYHTWASMVASTFTVAFGGSVGLEAPIVLTGSAIGSNVGKFFRVNRKKMMLLVGCGAAGAIAGIFKSPVAAVVFAIEVLMIDLTLTTLVPLVLSAVTGAMMAFFLSGHEVLFRFEPDTPFRLADIPWFIVLGITTGLISLYFTRTIFHVEKQIHSLQPAWKRLLTGGITLGVLIFLFPPLFGEGYKALEAVLNGNVSGLVNRGIFGSLSESHTGILLVLLLTLLFKAVASSATNGAGGVGGIFAPSLFMGGLTGYLTAAVLNMIPGINVSEVNFALVGMAGVMSGVMHAPLTGIFLIAEITGGYTLLTPLMITATVSFLTIRQFEPHSIYARRLAERGELLTHDKDKAALALMKIDSLLETNFVTIHPDATLGDFVKAVPKSQRNIFPVVDDENNFHGVVFINDLRSIIFDRELYDKVYIRQFMFMPEPLVELGESMSSVAEKFSRTENFTLPVLDKGKYVGFISRARVFSTYRELLAELSDD
ncbi:MAG: chloride channel protein [Bacteroidales bacterium]